MAELHCKISGCILMGGHSRRFGGDDKSQLMFGSEILLQRIIRVAGAQVQNLALAVGQNTGARCDGYDLPLLIDDFPDVGPLGGLHAGLKWAQPEAHFVATFACDTPSFPADMVEQLAHAATAGAAAIALPRCRGRIHTALGLWSTALLPELERTISAGELAITRWALEFGAVLVDFESASERDFFNINSPADAQRYQALLPN